MQNPADCGYMERTDVVMIGIEIHKRLEERDDSRNNRHGTPHNKSRVLTAFPKLKAPNTKPTGRVPFIPGATSIRNPYPDYKHLTPNLKEGSPSYLERPPNGPSGVSASLLTPSTRRRHDGRRCQEYEPSRTDSIEGVSCLIGAEGFDGG